MARLIFLIVSVMITAITIPQLYRENPELFLGATGNDEQRAKSSKIVVRQKAAPKTSNPLSGRKVRLEMDARGHFVSDFKLNGRTVTALVDTGATYVAINSKTARRIGIRLSPSDYKYTVNTANGQVKAAAARIEEIRIGRVTVENVETAVLPDDALDGTLVGMSFLKQLNSFEVRDRTLILQQ